MTEETEFEYEFEWTVTGTVRTTAPNLEQARQFAAADVTSFYSFRGLAVPTFELVDTTDGPTARNELIRRAQP